MFALTMGANLSNARGPYERKLKSETSHVFVDKKIHKGGRKKGDNTDQFSIKTTKEIADRVRHYKNIGKHESIGDVFSKAFKFYDALSDKNVHEFFGDFIKINFSDSDIVISEEFYQGALLGLVEHVRLFHLLTKIFETKYEGEDLEAALTMEREVLIKHFRDIIPVDLEEINNLIDNEIKHWEENSKEPERFRTKDIFSIGNNSVVEQSVDVNKGGESIKRPAGVLRRWMKLPWFP